MKLNQDKCNFLLSGRKHEVIFAKIGYSESWESCAQKFLGMIIDRNLKFGECILTQFEKTGKNLKALARVSLYLSLKRRRTLEAFIESQFVYGPLIFMFFLQILELITYTKELLEIVYKDNESAFEDLLCKELLVDIEQENCEFNWVLMF